VILVAWRPWRLAGVGVWLFGAVRYPPRGWLFGRGRGGFGFLAAVAMHGENVPEAGLARFTAAACFTAFAPEDGAARSAFPGRPRPGAFRRRGGTWRASKRRGPSPANAARPAIGHVRCGPVRGFRPPLRVPVP